METQELKLLCRKQSYRLDRNRCISCLLGEVGQRAGIQWNRDTSKYNEVNALQSGTLVFSL